MKKIQHIILGIAALTLCGCKLDYAPENTYVDEKVYKEQKTAYAALNGAYVRMNVFMSGAPQDQNNYANTGYTYLCGDLTTDNMELQENITYLKAIRAGEFTSSDHDGVLYNMWHWAYNAIDYANNIIRGINTYGQFDEEIERQYIAEAKFLRAYVYLQTLALFGDQALLGNDEGDGVVLQLTPYTGYDPDHPVGRSTNAECWAQIIDDLNQAIPDLPTKAPAANNRIHATRAVAQALLSRTYLWKGTYKNNQSDLQKAVEYAREALNSEYTFSHASTEFEQYLFPSNEYSQSDGYPNPTNYSNEVMLSEPSRIYTATYPNGLAYYQKKSYYVPEKMLDIYDDDDLRCTYLIGHGSSSDNAKFYTSHKYLGGQYDDVIYLRLSEVKLTLAEALARTTNSVTDEALTQLNDIHQRAFPEDKKPEYYEAQDFSDVNEFIKTVLIERRKELAYEGLHRYDLMRTGNLLRDNVLRVIPQARWNLPVPEYEIRLTDGLIKQNSGFEE